MIQLVKLREYEKNGIKKIYHDFFKPPITAPSVQDLFADVEHYVVQIPEKDRWNVYFTACKAEIGSRDLLEQDIIPFDIDNIDVDKKEQYIEPICAVLNLPSDEVGVVFSGNGLQFIVGLQKSFNDPKFFDENRTYYKAICDLIDIKLKEFGLPGNADPAVFSKARILRMPGTLNKKPNKPERKALVLRKDILNNGFDLQNISGIPKIKREEHIGSNELNKYGTPDTKSVLNECKFLKYIKRGDYTEPQWYGALSILSRLENGHKLSHEYSKVHSKYNPSVTDKKIGQAMQASGPRTCNNINFLWGMCGTCPQFSKIKSPIQIKSDDFVPQKVGGKISENFVVQKMIEIYGSKMVKKNEDLFIYSQGLWKYLSNDEICSLKNQIIGFFGADGKSKDAESAFKNFYYKLKISPVEMFKPNPYCVNFLNGTLHIYKKSDQSWGKEFREHNQEDYLINQLPYDYLPYNKEQNFEFLKMLDRVFEKDKDKDEKILAIKQMYGACLLPAFPHLFMLHGEAGTGKTSVILPLYEFLKQDNICSVEPYQFNGFFMEGMAGKLVNIVTDINTNKPIEDANIKKIEDRVPFRIDRKFRSVVYAPLPAIHIFGGNDIPPTLDGGSRAHTRRWTFIEFKSLQVSGHYDKSFSQWVFNQSPRGVLNFALEGLDELIMSRGHFLNPSSGKEKIEEWMAEGDVVSLFLKDIEDGEVINEENYKLTRDTEGRMNRVEFYEFFVEWFERAGHGNSRVLGKKSFPKNIFFKELIAKKCNLHKYNGTNCIFGFSSVFMSGM